MIKICICGGGSLGHVCSGVLASQPDVSINILTQHPKQWSNEIVVTDKDGKQYIARPHMITDDAQHAVAECDIVFLCLPGFAIEHTLLSIKPFLDSRTVVGSIVSSTGFFFAAHRVLGENAKLFGFQRTPFIARTEVYGRTANLLGYKPEVAIAVENVEDKEEFCRLVERLWITPTRMLGSHYEVSLTNSNPILHTGRLYSMWKEWDGEMYDHNSLFYKEWTDDASQLIIDMDAEFQQLLKALPVTEGAIPTLLDYYESYDAASLTQKIRSIPAFQTITSPMKEVNGGWIPDFSSRYFTEDFPFGLRFVVDLMHVHGISSSIVDAVYQWGISKVG